MITNFDKQVIYKLRERNVRPSSVRVHISNYLLQRRNHPTPDTLYAALAEGLPSLSRTSVYNALGALTEAGLVRRVGIEGGEMRYDAEMCDHGHFKCTDCGEVFDFEADFKEKGLEGFRVERRDMFLWGRCKNCAEKSGKIAQPGKNG
jgi:Fur family peroxide stress response transcriptional regulator